MWKDVDVADSKKTKRLSKEEIKMQLLEFDDHRFNCRI